MLKKILIVMFIILFPNIVLAKEFKYEESELEYKLDDTIWEYKNEVEEDGYQISLYESNNISLLIIYTDSYEYYGGDDIDRMYLNYKNLISNDYIYNRDEIYKEISKQYGASGEYSYVTKNVSFVVYNTLTDRGDTKIDSCELYETINNGYEISFEFCKKTGSDETMFNEEVENVISTVNATGNVIDYKLNTQDEESWSEVFANLFIGIIITMIYYMSFPFILFVLFKKKYSPQKITIILIINSVILCLISNTYAILYTEESIRITPAYFWYLINECAFNKEKRKKNKNSKEERHEGFEDI